MAKPIIDTRTSVLGFRQGEAWAYQPAASGNPSRWEWRGLPIGVTADVSEDFWAISGVASTDTVKIVADDAIFENGDTVVLLELSGGSGLVVDKTYYVVGASMDAPHFIFNLALVPGGGPVGFSTDITFGVIARSSTGLISGPASWPGSYNSVVTAFNEDGASDELAVFIGISPRQGGGDGGILVNVDTRTCGVYPPSLDKWQEGMPVAFGKNGDTLVLDVGFTDNGGYSLMAMVLGSVKCAIKHLDGDKVLTESDGEFVPFGDLDNTRYRIFVPLPEKKLGAVLSEYEDDGGTSFLALAEIEWVQQMFTNSGSVDVTRSSQTFRIQIGNQLIKST